VSVYFTVSYQCQQTGHISGPVMLDTEIGQQWATDSLTNITSGEQEQF